MTDDSRRIALSGAEEWFERHGLPYFVDGNEDRVHASLRWPRLAPVLAVATLLATSVGVFVGFATDGVFAAVVIAAVVLGFEALLYALASLHFLPIVRWAVEQTFGSLGWIFPLVTRALPLLLLFMTFLFINTEVWQVTSALDRGLLWLTVLLFAVVAVVFLLVRLPEEVRDVGRRAKGDTLVIICAGTPVEGIAGEVASDAGDVVLSRLQRLNLVLVLLFAQALQVMLLALSVFAFFIVFGKLAIEDSVIQEWLGEGTADAPIPSSLPSLDWLPISNELFQVSVFLAAFSGLYFTVYAVTDENYRRQFFTDISRELERAIAVHRVYCTLTHDR